MLKILDVFAEKLNAEVESIVSEVNGLKAEYFSLNELVSNIAEQLKGGAE